MIFRDADACNLCRKIWQMQTSYETMECNGKLYNVHDILSLFYDFDFDLIFLGKHRLTVLILSFANLYENSLRVYVLFDLVT